MYDTCLCLSFILRKIEKYSGVEHAVVLILVQLKVFILSLTCGKNYSSKDNTLCAM